MIALRDLQRQFAGGLRATDTNAFVQWISGDLAAERLEIYRRNREAALRIALELTYPAVSALVGSSFFAATAGDYAVFSPPRSAHLGDYGADFPTFLKMYRPAAGLAYLSDVARLEWTVAQCACDGKGHARYPIGDHVLSLPAGLSQIKVAYPAAAIWRAALDQDEQALARLDPSAAPATLAVWRDGAGADVCEISDAAASFLLVLLESGDVEAALADAAAQVTDPVGVIARDVFHAPFASLISTEGEHS